METQDRTKIYERLLAINFKMDTQDTPNLIYINSKIGECHVLIEEMGRYFIQASREQSAVQTALYNATAKYEYTKENLLTTNKEIKELPNIKDRESRANTLLKDELNDIKLYKNQLAEVGTLIKAISLKRQDLIRANGDIKMQLKLLDTQRWLGATPESEKSLADELKKGSMEMDSFENAESSLTEENVLDPNEPVNINNLLNAQDKPVDDMFGMGADLPAKLLEPVQQEMPVEEGFDFEPYSVGGSDVMVEVEESIQNAVKIDFEKVIDPGEAKPEQYPADALLSEGLVLPASVPEIQIKDPNTNVTQKETGGAIDFDALLSQFR